MMKLVSFLPLFFVAANCTLWQDCGKKNATLHFNSVVSDPDPVLHYYYHHHCLLSLLSLLLSSFWGGPSFVCSSCLLAPTSRLFAQMAPLQCAALHRAEPDNHQKGMGRCRPGQQLHRGVLAILVRSRLPRQGRQHQVENRASVGPLPENQPGHLR